MSQTKISFVKRRSTKLKTVGILCFLVAALCITASFPIIRNTISANDGKSAVTAIPENTPPSKIPPQIQALRVKIAVGETQDVPITAITVKSVMVVSPEIATAQIKNGNTLTITGLKAGETILIVSDSQNRRTLVVEVGGKRAAAERRDIINAERAENERAKMSGSYTATYIQSFNGDPSLLRNSVEFRRNFSKDRILRVSGETFKLMGSKERNPTLAQLQSFGFDRLSVGVDSPDKSVDFLDSRIRVSPLSFNSFQMRGFHLVKTSKSLTNSDTSIKGVEVFAGLARPSLELYDNDQGKIAGAFLPVVSSKSGQLSTGFIVVSPQKNNRIARGGTILQLNGSYTPNKNLSADGEIAYANGGLSWRTRLDLKLRQFGAYGEMTRFDKDSPLNSIGAQAGGRKSEALAFYWRPDNRFSFSTNYSHTEITRLVSSKLADFNRSTFSASANYRINRNSQLNLRFLDQQIETAVPGGASKFQIGTRSITVGHNTRFNQNWANNFEARINFSREARTDTEMENGFNLSEQIRFSWSRNSVAGFFNYTYKTPSLTSLIVRNPRILPPLLQDTFVSDPAQFLQIYRDRLDSLLNGIELPLTRSLDTGVRFQTTVSRFTLAGETRYNAGEILSYNQKNLLTSVSLDMRLDAANSLQVNGWKSFGAGSQSAITLSFTHRFGAGIGEGFQFSKLLGFDKGRVQGRVYHDLNGNGQDDAGEPGVVGTTIRLDEKRSVTTDINGRYQFSANEGGHNIALISTDLGVRLRATTVTQQRISLYSRQTVNVSFGVLDFGFVSGRVFNDLNLSAIAPQSNVLGINGVKVILRSENSIVEQITSGGGAYEFQNLRPGNYTLKIDLATLPANFRLPAQSSWEIKVEPLQGFYFDIPVAAQRAIIGIVFVDKDHDGKFNPQIDSPVAGASVTANGSVAVSDSNGAYILRNLPAGKIELLASSPQGAKNILPLVLELGVDSITKRSINLIVSR